MNVFQKIVKMPVYKVLLILLGLFFFISCMQSQNALEWPEITKETKPWTRWWWMGSIVNENDLTSAMEAYKKAGLGGLEITPIYGVKGYEDKFIPYLSDDWMKMLTHTLQEGQRLDLGIDMATGTGWPFGGPWIGADDACKYVAYKTYKLNSGERLSDQVQYIQEPVVRAVGHRIDISELVEPISANQNLQKLALDQVRFEKELPLQSLMAYSDQGQILDLTKFVNNTGHLDWTAAQGHWTLYAIFMGWHGKMVERAAPGGEGNVIDHFSSRSLGQYLVRFNQAFANNDIHGLRAFFNDSYEVDDARGQADWTQHLFDEFKSRRGYDLHAYLPDLFAKDSSERSRRVVSDYRETISDLLLAEFTEKWNSWAKDKGAITRNQAHGSPANILDLYAASGIPETEGDDLLGIKLASSAANISGKMLTSSETATWLEEHFQASLGEVKKTVDHFFLGGVNHIIYHGTTFSPQDESWPGWMFYASVHFGLTNSFWGDFPVLNEYVARCQSFLQKSQADNDILLYFPFYDLVTQPGREMLQHISSRTTQLPLPNFISAARLLQDKGYAIDYISDRQIKNLIYQDGILKSGKSVYKVIIFPECDYLSLETLEKLFDLADKGASIIVHNKFPGDVPGLYEFEKRREKMSNLTGRLKFSVVGSGNIQKASVGNGQVLIGTDLDALLAYVNVKRESMVDKGLQYIRKNYSDGKIYFINNPGDSAFEGWIPVKTDVVSAALFNPMHKTMGKAGLRKAENYVEVYLQLQPGESLILNTFSTTINSPYYPYYQIAADKQPVTGTWDITFVKGGPSLPGMIKTDSLVSWTNLGDENTRAFSGTAEYTIDLNLTVRENDLLLDLGQVCESAVVILNDKKVASLISAPYSCIISQKMLRESNQLKIVVSNLMANRIANLDKQTSSWKKFYNVNFPAGLAENRAAEGLFTAKNWQPEESGLIGPVTITPVKKPKFD